VLGPADVSAKLDALIALIEEAPGEKWVVFTTFAEVVDLIVRRLRGAGISFVPLRGGMGSTGIAAVVKMFQTGPTQVLVGTVQTGGEGLDLTAARQLVFVDQWWDPRVRYQAYKRLDRRGQTRSVVVTTLECIGTIDETISKLLDRKEAATAEVVRSEVLKDLERGRK
jgi:SNF2 family DNA or RNA helicase